MNFLLLSLLSAACAQAELKYEFKTELMTGADGIERRVEVMLPSDTENPGRKFPVLYYFSGSKGELPKDQVPSEIKEVHMDKLSQTLVRLGVMEPTIFVNPVINEAVVDGADGTKNASFIYDTVLPAEAKWNGDGRRSISGNSLGGLAATNLVMHKPEVFDSLILRQPLIFEGKAPWLKTDAELRDFFRQTKGKELDPWVYDLMKSIRKKVPDQAATQAIMPIGEVAEKKLPRLYMDYGDEDKYLDLGDLRKMAKNWPAGVEVRERHQLDHGGDLAVMGLIDSVLAAKFQKGANPTPAGQLLLKLSKQDKLAPIIKDFFLGNVLDGLAKFARAIEKENITLSKEDLQHLRDLVSAIAPNPVSRAFLDALQSLKILPGKLPGSVEVKIGMKPKSCAKDSLSQPGCLEDRFYLPLDNPAVWERALKLAKVHGEAVLAGRSGGCNQSEPNFSQEVIGLTRQLNAVLAELDGAGQKTLEIQPEFSFTVNAAGNDDVKVENCHGLSVLAGLPFGLQPDVAAVKITRNDGIKIRVRKFGLEIEKSM
jgi:S-formylglutathione hydrolase FrmB